MPLYLADYVLMGYGTGAIMAVPGQDQRDWDFANALRPADRPHRAAARRLGGRGVHRRRPGHQQRVARRARQGRRHRARPSSGSRSRASARRTVNYRLRDWLLSRQRFWGCPIPIVYCPDHGIRARARRPAARCWRPTTSSSCPTGESPLQLHEGFLHTTCPNCGGPAARETDTMDTFVDSSWYFLRFTDPWNADGPFSHRGGRAVDAGRPVHRRRRARHPAPDVRPLLHQGAGRPRASRPKELREPFTRLFTQGMIRLGGDKMSKSKGNLVAPEDDPRHARAPTRCAWPTCSSARRRTTSTGRASASRAAHRFLHRLWRLADRRRPCRRAVDRAADAADDAIDARHPPADRAGHRRVRALVVQHRGRRRSWSSPTSSTATCRARRRATETLTSPSTRCCC